MNRSRLGLALFLAGLLFSISAPAAAENPSAKRLRKPQRTPKGAVAVTAQPAGPALETGPRCAASDNVGSAGMRAYIDPVTGERREPTPEEARALSAAIERPVSRSEDGFEVIYHANGAVSVDLKDAFQMDVVAKKGPNGSITIHCLPASQKVAAPAAKPGHPPAAPAPTLEEK